MEKAFLSNFQKIIPSFELSQEETLDWVASRHSEAEALIKNLSAEEKVRFKNYLKTLLNKIGLGPEKIEKRKLFFDDFLKLESLENQIYDLSNDPNGKSARVRNDLYSKITSELLDRFYESATYPDHIIHTSCTGYSSPSGAQRLVSKKGWGDKTQVTHAYHMGCYASIPSLRIASGFIKNSSRVDIVHTEFCTLHMDPTNHSMGQLVIESLFADGAISYQITKNDSPACPHFEVIALKEEILEDSSKDMSWDISDYGFRMQLSKDVPKKIGSALLQFVPRLLQMANLSDDHMEKMIVAIHPGGPKIIEEVASVLCLKSSQYVYSQEILKRHGNMSSATLPHVWDLILSDEKLKNNTLVLSLAFGPGLTMAGSIFRLKK